MILYQPATLHLVVYLLSPTCTIGALPQGAKEYPSLEGEAGQPNSCQCLMVKLRVDNKCRQEIQVCKFKQLQSTSPFSPSFPVELSVDIFSSERISFRKFLCYT